MNAYNYLKDFCKVRNTRNSWKIYRNPYTERVRFILSAINNMGLKSRSILFNPNTLEDIRFKEKVDKLINISVEFISNIELPTLIFIAHHDVNNNHSDNMNDNSASVSHILELCEWMKSQEIKDKNIILYFTDREEFGSLGGRKLAHDINLGKYGSKVKVINLELTGVGTEIHAEDVDSSLLDGITKLTESKVHLLNVPFNDSLRLRSNGVDSVCLGLLSVKAIFERKSGRYPHTWMLCHSNDDKFENADENDMNVFNTYLKNIIGGYNF